MKTEKVVYEVGALATTFISVGVVSIIYGAGFLVFDLLNLIAWILTPLGTYTVVYAIAKRKHMIYYTSWGLIMLTIGLTLTSYKVINPFIMLGILVIGLAIIGLVAYLRRGKVGESS